MKILEKEIALREETRSLEQARSAMAMDKYENDALPLAESQDALKKRTTDVVQKIRELPDGEAQFGKEINLLRRVVQVMDEAREILTRPDTGSEAISAESEVIELLLQAKRTNPKKSGGSGANPGGGGAGTTEHSALALLGDGSDEEASIKDRMTSQSTGVSGRELPAEFRSGLDVFFSSLDRRPEAKSGDE